MLQFAADHRYGHVAWGMAMGVAFAKWGSAADWPWWSVPVLAAIGFAGMVHSYITS